MRRQQLVVLALTLLAFALRLAWLDRYGLWVDEGFTWEMASAPWERFVGLLASDMHPPTHYLLLRGWLPLAGESEYALRFPSVLFGVLAVPLLYRLGSRLAGPGPGVVAALLLTVAPFHVAFSQEARNYSLMVTLALAATVGVLRVSSESKGRGGWPATAVAMAGSFYAHYLNVVVLLAAGAAALLLAWDKPTALRRWLAAHLGAALLALPWLPVYLDQASRYTSPGLEPVETMAALGALLDAFTVGEPGAFPSPRPWALGAVALGVVAPVVAALAGRGRRGPWNTSDPTATASPRPSPNRLTNLAAAVLLVALPLGVLVGLLQVRPNFHPKYWLPLAPLSYLLVAWGLVDGIRVARRLPLPVGAVVGGLGALTGVALLLGAVTGLVGYLSGAALAKDEVLGVAAYLRQHATSDDVVVLVDYPWPIGYYYRGPAPLHAVQDWGLDTAARLSELVQGRRTVLHVHWFPSRADLVGAVPFLLDRAGERRAERVFRGYLVTTYELRQPLPATFDVAPREGPTFEGGVRLVAVGYGPTGRATSGLVESGGQLWVALRWRLVAPTARAYRAAVILRDPRGHEVARGDRELAAGQLGTADWAVGQEGGTYFLLDLPPGSPPGSYELVVRLYHRGDAPPERALDDAGRPGPPELVLGHVPVVASRRPVDPQTVSVPNPVRRDFEGGLTLLGYDLPRPTVTVGDALQLVAYWWARSDLGEVPVAAFDLVDGQGRARTIAEGPAGGSALADWARGQLVVERLSATVPPDVPPGTYTLRLRVVEPGGDTRAEVVELGPVEVQDRPRRFTLPSVPRVVAVRLGDLAELVGYDLGPARPGEPLQLTLYWRALGPSPQRYKVFTHLLDDGSRVVAQDDSEPGRGAFPTTGWVAGEIIEDRYVLALPDDLAPGHYTLEVGMYDPRSGERVPVLRSDVPVRDDAALLTEVAVAASR